MASSTDLVTPLVGECPTVVEHPLALRLRSRAALNPVLGDESTVALDQLHAAPMIGSNDAPQILGVELGRKCGRAHEIAEHDRELPPIGDGVLAYFGYPQAHEHAAERAIQAGLALIEAVPKLMTAASVPLQARIGIASGLVVVGDLTGAVAAKEQAVVGETPNLAVRLQALAEPGAVVIASSTRKLAAYSSIANSARSRSRRERVLRRRCSEAALKVIGVRRS